MAEGEQVRGVQQSDLCKINTANVADYEVAQLHGADTLCACVCVCVYGCSSSQEMWNWFDLRLGCLSHFFYM